MSKTTNLAPLKIGSDHGYVFHVRNEDESESIDVAGWAISFMLKYRVSDLDAAALLTKTVAGGGIAIGGAYNSVPANNLQRVTVTIADTDTDALAPRVVEWELKRMDSNFETPLGDGVVELRRGVHRT